MSKQKNEAVGEFSPVSAAYIAATSIDESGPIAERLAVIRTSVDLTSQESVKESRKKLSALLKRVKDPRMTVQRAIKTHPVGAFAFAKTDLEREIEEYDGELKQIAADLKASEETRHLTQDVLHYCLVVTGRIDEINKLVGRLAEQGYEVENRGPIEYASIGGSHDVGSSDPLGSAGPL